MGKRNLPVRIFSKREIIDECAVEGMGGSELPKWALSGLELKNRAEQLISEVECARESLNKRRKEREFIPITVTAKLNDEAKAKSYRKNISKLFDTKQDDNIIGLVNEENLIIKIKDKIDLDQIQGRLKRTDNNVIAISAIEYIELFKPTIEYTHKEGNKLKAKLLNYNNYELDLAVSNTFEKICKENEIVYRKTNYTEDIAVYKLETDSLDKIKFLEDFEGIYSIEDMPSYTISDFDSFGDFPKPKVKVMDNNIQYPIVGVMDTGIEKNQYLDGWLLDEKNASFVDEELLKKHGTFVAGIVAYGDELENKDYTGVKGCRVFDSSIFSEVVEVDQDVLIDNIEQSLRRYGDKIKIWNLSIGTRVEADVDKFSDFGMALDALQDKYDVIICKSAGNCSNFANGAPKSRISKSADSVRSVVVGSIAHKQVDGDLAKVNYPSPFTRIGRGPSYIIKPDLVHYGGNARVNEDGSIGITGVKSFSQNGSIREDSGTSFSTPRVSAILAGIQNELKDGFDPLLIKGLAIHSANYPENIELPLGERINQMGFGVPKKVNDILYNTPNEITLIMKDQITKGEYTEILDFPYPKSMIQNGMFYGQIVVTVIYNPILDPTQGAEYCQTNLEVKLGTYDKKIARDMSKPYIKNPIGKEDGKNILSQSCYSKRAIRTNSCEFGKKERLLVQYGDKFYPVKKYAVDLDEMTEANKIKYLSEDRQWYLKIEGLFRDSIIRKSEKKGDDLYQDFCVLITIRDQKNTENPVYNEVTTMLTYNNFLHSSIGLNNNINVSVNENDDDNDELKKLINDIMENN